jgi:L-methionine (R)-S-oxide reductase
VSSHDVYNRLEEQARALLDREADFVANAGNFAALIRNELPRVNWAGFYLAAANGELVLGPFSGRPACTRIAKGRGVCGAAAEQRATIVVADVEAFADHIACDAASRSEIVVPLFIRDLFFGVFDVDSPTLARFTDADRVGLERLVAVFGESLTPQTSAR